jgi:hypothetical protein
MWFRRSVLPPTITTMVIIKLMEGLRFMTIQYSIMGRKMINAVCFVRKESDMNNPARMYDLDESLNLTM